MAAGSLDIILITGDHFADHPLNGAGLLKRFLEREGFTVGVISKPDWTRDEDFTGSGVPALFFGITSGAIDSMLQNYTSLKRLRKEDPNVPHESGVPDRAVIVYANRIRQLFKGIPIVLGGVEASLRRFAHYDYWDNKVRNSILFDSRADILVYGPGEYPLLAIAERLREDRDADLKGIASTCVVAKHVPEGFTDLPSFEETVENAAAFCRMQTMLSNDRDLAQRFQKRYVLQYRMHRCTPAELDHVYDLPFSRDIPPEARELEMARFSVVTHRGCIGRCNFCSLTLLEGDRIVSRSEKSILNEIARMSGHPEFKGYVDDLGGPSANMYGMDCANRNCGDICLHCGSLDRSNIRLIRLMKEARAVRGVKKVFVRSGIRYDLVSRAYLEELSGHHVSGTLKIAPEHFSPRVLELMNKHYGDLKAFVRLFLALNEDTGQALRYYLMTCHPGETMEHVEQMRREMSAVDNTESLQIFLPLPMTVSACMYHTGMHPLTMERIPVVRTFREKKQRRNMLTEVTQTGYAKGGKRRRSRR